MAVWSASVPHATCHGQVDSANLRQRSVQVVAPAPGGPAERAGIKPLDAVVAIDGKNTKGISLFEAGDLLQGEDGSQVQPDPCLLILAGPSMLFCKQ